jgi:UPF0716 family protein affecting phage T7 exclusion
MQVMKRYSRREIAGAVLFLAGLLLFIAGIITAKMTLPLFYASVALMTAGSWVAGGSVSVED